MEAREKYVLTIPEAAKYYSIGIKKMRSLADENIDTFAVRNGNRFLIIKSKFEEFLQNSTEI